MTYVLHLEAGLKNLSYSRDPHQIQDKLFLIGFQCFFYLGFGCAFFPKIFKVQRYSDNKLALSG